MITGAGSGIGRAVAELVAREGAGRLILVDLKEGDELAAACDVEWLTGDVADESFWNAARIGEIDHAVINAGVSAHRVRQIRHPESDGIRGSPRQELAQSGDHGHGRTSRTATAHHLPKTRHDLVYLRCRDVLGNGSHVLVSNPVEVCTDHPRQARACFTSTAAASIGSVTGVFVFADASEP